MSEFPKKYKTRDGRDAEVWSDNGKGAFPLLGMVEIQNEWLLARWDTDGKYIGMEDNDNSLTLPPPEDEVCTIESVEEIHPCHNGFVVGDKVELMRDEDGAPVAIPAKVAEYYRKNIFPRDTSQDCGEHEFVVPEEPWRVLEAKRLDGTIARHTVRWARKVEKC